MTRILRSLAAIAAIAAITLGTPWLLLRLARLPGFLPSWDRLASMLLAPDSGRFLLILVWAAAWLLWAWLTALIVIEAAALLRGVKAPRLPAASLPQGLARGLVLAAAAAFIAAPQTVAAEPPDPAAPLPGSAAAAASSMQPTRANPASPPAPSTAVELDSITVAKGDTLWDLADAHLGDSHRWPELYDANKGIPQPNGYTLEDPDQIDVGWTLALPSDVERTAEPATLPSADAATTALLPSEANDANTTSAPAEPQAARSASPTPMITAERSSATAPTSTAAPSLTSATPLRAEAAAPEDADWSEAPPFVWEVAGLLGAGTFLGVGVGAVLAARRREQYRTRRPGRMIANPSPVVAPIEQTARLATGLSSRLVTRLEQVLRRLDPHTEIAAVAVARDGTLHLYSPTDLGSPWTRDGDHWLLPNTVTVDTIGEHIADRPCPWPLLVTIGADADDRVVLFNLDQAGRVTITGDPVMSADFERYVAAELAVNPWSEDIRVACHGPAAHAIGMCPARLDADPEEILTLARTNLDRATDAEVTAAVGRALQAGDDTWTAGVVITDQLDTLDGLHNIIADHRQQTGTAMIVFHPTQGEWTLTADGRLTSPAFELTAVGLTEDEAAGCAELLAATDTGHDTTPEPADDLVDVTGNVLEEHRTPRDQTNPGTVEPVLPEPDAAYIDAAVVTADDLTILAPRITDDTAAALQDRDRGLDADVRAWFSPRCPYPRLALLGPVAARCHGRPVTKRKAYYTEALTYLALHPHGVTGDQVADALGTTVERARTVISDLRQWLGTNPRTRQPHIPDAKNSPQARARGVGLYLVEDLLVDADLFRRLRSRGVAAGRDGIEDLEAALQLVTGRPFDQLRPAGWTWLIDGDRTDQHLMCAITDVAHILVTHHLHTGDLEAAKRAVSTALRADPDSETARLDLAGIMVHEGHTTSARRILAEALGDDVDLDPTARATEILNGKNWLRTG
ncbi:tetratricopeptide repeat protein [Tessaracoccus defluvii]